MPEEAPPWASFDDSPVDAPVAADAEPLDVDDAASTSPAGATGLHRPSAFDLADDEPADDLNDDGSDMGYSDSDSDRPLGD